jgi:hypothetical protein
LCAFGNAGDLQEAALPLRQAEGTQGVRLGMGMPLGIGMLLGIGVLLRVGVSPGMGICM